jgi:AAHS family 4-hydroxybenzoate transporter-like MFS transporter
LAVCLILLLALPESPRFLAGWPVTERLTRVLRRMDIALPPGAIVVESGAASRRIGSLAALFGPGTLVPTMALWGGFFFCFLGVYSSLNWMPTLLGSHHYNLAATSSALAAAGIGGMIGSLAMAKLIEAIGSRLALLAAGVGLAAGIAALVRLPLDPAASLVPLLLALAWVSLCLNAITGCIYALAAHVYPPVVKATGMGAAGSVGRIGAITSSYAAVAVLAISSNAFFGFIGGAGVVAIVCLMALRRHIPSDRAMATVPVGVA